MNYISEPKMKGGGVSQKHTAVGQRGNQIVFKAVCFSDRSGRWGENGGGEGGLRQENCT